MGYFKRGHQRGLATGARMHEADVSLILSRRLRATPHRAVALQNAAKELGYDIPFEHWLWNLETEHPAFKGDPKLLAPEGVDLTLA